MHYNVDFLISAAFILAIVLFHFACRRRTDDLNTHAFGILAALSAMDVVFEIISTWYIVFCAGSYSFGAVASTTIFYLFQAMLPFALVYYVFTLHENRITPSLRVILMGMPTMILCGIILTNPITGMLFYFDAVGYQRGPWYMIMYYSAMAHFSVAMLFVVLWRKTMDRNRIKALFEILLLVTAGVAVQTANQSILTTGFGTSLGVLALFITINNPHINIDSLTGLHDKQYLIRRLDELIANDRSFHVITVDVYQLEQINKISGVQGGDELLRTVTAKLKGLCGRVYRMTGKRFLLLTFTLEEYDRLAGDLKRLFEHNASSGDARAVIASPAVLSGIVNAERLGSGSLVLDYAEYLESLSPKSGVTELVQDDRKTMLSFNRSKKIEQFLYEAIEQDLFEVYYQPVYSIKEKGYITLEALSRLNHPEFGWIPPDVFIQLAEKNRLINQVTELQFRRVCRFIKENEPVLSAQIRNVKFNLSPLDLLNSDHGRRFVQVMDEYGLPHDSIQFEITETMATEYTANLYKMIEEFRKQGIHLCLDDFGSGYANLNTVMRLPFSVIKLDRSLLHNICSDARSATFYHSIVVTLQNIGYYIVAEGVETRDEFELLSGWGVDMIQGYFFSRPLPPSELLQTLREQAAK